VTYKDLLILARRAKFAPHNGVIERGRCSPIYYAGIDRDGIIYAVSGHKKKYIIELYIDGMKECIDLVNANVIRSHRDVIGRMKNAIATGDVEVFCSCPAFLYWGYRYICSKLHIGHDIREFRYPRIRNPKLEGSICRHLAQFLIYIPKITNKIASDIWIKKYCKHSLSERIRWRKQYE